MNLNDTLNMYWIENGWFDELELEHVLKWIEMEEDARYWNGWPPYQDYDLN